MNPYFEKAKREQWQLERRGLFRFSLLLLTVAVVGAALVIRTMRGG